MIRKFFFSLLFTGLSASVIFSQTPDWKWQNPLPTVSQLEDIFFLNHETGWIVGSAATILKTNDGGSSWISQTIALKTDLQAIQFINDQTGWAVGSNGVIVKTMNGGKSWTKQTSNTTSFLRSVHFQDLQTGWVTGTGGFILKTTNGGLTWTTLNSGSTNSFYGICVKDLQTAWAVGANGTIRKTSNGGNTWSTQTSGTTNSIWSVHFKDMQNGVAVGGTGTILKTTNGGTTWNPITSGTNRHLYNLHFTDTQNGWAVGMYGTILKTTDGGSTWISQSVATYEDYSAAFFTDPNTGWFVGSHGLILKSNDGGTTKVNIKTGGDNDLRSVSFPSPTTGWAVGEAGTILKTRNSGKTWIPQVSGTTKMLYSVCFVDDQTGWAAGGLATILKTSDGGTNWVQQSCGINEDMWSISFIDAQTGWVVGRSGALAKTIDGGTTWITQSFGTSLSFISVQFVNSQTGYALGLGGKLLKTTNGGTAWTDVSPGTTSRNSIFFINADTGWVTGLYGVMDKTTDGGQTWASQNTGSHIFLESVHFLDAQNGIAVGDTATIIRTTDGGTTWTKQKSGTGQFFYSGCMVDTNTAWAVGTNGCIMTTITNNPIDPETPASLVTGTIFKKTGADCNPTNNPDPIANFLVKAMPGSFYSLSNSLGNYNFRLPLGNVPETYTLEALPVIQNSIYQFTPVCPPSGQNSIQLDTIPDTLAGANFGYDIPNCHHLNVEIASNRRRRCFQNSNTVTFLNQGTIAATDAYVLVEFPHWVRPASATRPYSALNDSTWKFDLGTVQAGAIGTIGIIDSVLCAGPMELSQCTKATIYPAPDCPPPSNWSGANVSVSGVCDNGTVHLGIYNTGTGDMTDSVDYTVFLDSTLVRIGKVKLVAGGSYNLDADAYGMTVTLSANQVPFHPTESFVSTTIEACDDTVIFYPRPTVNHFPKSQTANSKIHCLPIRSSFDPNDKQAFPIGFTSTHNVKPGTEMEYLVRFQNTGNDTAFTVYVIDSLDNNLNPESIEFVAASHPHTISMQTTKQGRTFLRWQFNRINLPDSNTNELKSHGFFQYRISPKTGIALGSQAKNEAAIYFDFNDPVWTNRTLTTFDNLVFTNPGLSDSVHVVVPTKTALSLKQLGVEIYPNPFTNSLHLKSSSQNPVTASLCDLMGKEVKTWQFRSALELSLNQIPAGLYYLKFPELQRVMKVVKE